MRVLISAGGTGGHIYPALSIINKIKDMEPDSKILYIGTQDRMEKDLIPELNIPYFGIQMKGINRKNFFDNIKVVSMYRKALKTASLKIKEFDPDVVIGVGGYITAPVVMAAHKAGYKTIIHEQNSIPGISNKILAKYADKVLVSLPGSVQYFDKNKTVYTGNPRSEEIVKIKPLKKSELGFSDEKKLVVIVMGSLGSATINQKELELVPKFEGKDYQVLLITGEKYFASYDKIKIPKNVKVFPFVKNLINVLKVTDLIVSRAGASTLAELTAIGLPSILVPSPYVTNNHQYKNAQELEKVGAAIILEEDKFASDTLILLIDQVLKDDEKYKQMVESTLKLGVTTSATKVYNEIKKVVEGR